MATDIDFGQARSLTDFLRNHREHVDRLCMTDEPEVLTINGRPSVVVQSADGYDALLARLEYAENVFALRRALGQASQADFLTLSASNDVERVIADLDENAKNWWIDGLRRAIVSRAYSIPVEAADLDEGVREVMYRSYRVIFAVSKPPIVLRLFKGAGQSMTLNLLKSRL